MLSKKRLWIAIVLVIILLSLLFPPVYWRAIGYIRGEAFYKGRPTSYWHIELKEWDEGPPPPSWQHDFLARFGITSTQARPSILVQDDWTGELLYSVRRYGNFPYTDLPPPEVLARLLADQEEALPVLVELLKDEDEDVKLWAIVTVSRLGSDAESAITPLKRLLKDKSPKVRRAAGLALKRIDPVEAVQAGID